MPTVHYFSRETLRKHGIDPLQWEVTHSKKQRATNDAFVANVKTEVDDWTIRNNAVGPAAAKSGVQQPPYKSTGMDDNDIDAEDQSHDGKGIHQKIDNLQDDDECPNKPSEQKVHKVKKKSITDFFRRVDKLRAYKEKHGHLDVGYKDDPNLYGFCNNVRLSRRAIISGKGAPYKLTDDRIAALDAIGFNWNPGTSSTAATKDDKFFGRVDELRAYKDKHGHLNVSHKVDPRLYHFCCDMRAARKGKKGSYRLDETRITALDAIGFNWDPQGLNLSSTLPSAVTSKSTQQATNPKINIGDVGYQFLKEFDSGWYYGKVVEILPHADDGWDRRCVYEDGDCEDLALSELKRLATLSPQEHVGAIEVVGDVKMVDDGGMKVAASVGESILAAKVNPVIQKAARLKQRPVSKTTTSSMDDLLLTKNSKSSSNNNKAMATDLASLSSVNYDDLTIRELKQVPELTQHIVAIEEVLRNMRRG
jgi:hypothetical protein